MKDKFSKNTPENHFFTDADLHLLDFPQIYSISSIWYEKGMQDNIATFDLIVRDMPKNRNFMIAGGLEEILKKLFEWKYSEKEIAYLLRKKIITKNFAKYLKKFKFSGEIYAIPEGTIFYPGEPVIRVTAPIIEANLLTIFLINTFISNSIFFTKFIRWRIAAKEKPLIGAGAFRAHGFESGMKANRAAYLCGISIVNPSFYLKYNLEQPPVITVAYHAYIKSMTNEIEAFSEINKVFPNSPINLMVDTYSIDTGIKNAIKVIQDLKDRKQPIPKIIIDSGDLDKNTRYARKILDKNNLKDVKISIASNLDEYKITKFVKEKVPADVFVGGTEGITVADDPKLETVYKIAEIDDGKTIKKLAKLSENKISLPGKKNIYRIYKNKKMIGDIIGEEGENLGKPLLEKFISQGKLVRKMPDFEEIKEYIKKQIEELPEKFLDINKNYPYKISLSKKIQFELKKIKNENRHSSF